MAVFSEGGLSSPDLYIGLACILVVIICTALNSLVFLHNYRKKRSVARTLYLCLNVSDIFSAVTLLGCYSANVLSEKGERCRGMKSREEVRCGEEYYKYGRLAELPERIQSVFSWSACLLPSHFTAFLATCRYYQIKYPLRHLKIKQVVFAVFLSFILTPTVVACAVLDIRGDNREVLWMPVTNIAWNFAPRVFGIKVSSKSFCLIMTTPTALILAVSVVASLLTVRELVTMYLNPISEKSREVSARGSVKVLVTNLGSVLCIVFTVLAIYNTTDSTGDIDIPKALIYLMFGMVVPVCVSTLNPIIYIVFTFQEVKKIFRVIAPVTD